MFSSMSLSPGFGICLPLHELPSGWSYRCRWHRGLPKESVPAGCFWKVIGSSENPTCAPLKSGSWGKKPLPFQWTCFFFWFSEVYIICHLLKKCRMETQRNCFAGQDRHYLGCKERAGGKPCAKKQSYLTCRIVPRECT